MKEADIRNNPLTVGFYTPQNPTGDNAERQVIVSDSARATASDDDVWSAESEDPKPAQTYLLPNSDKEADRRSRERLDEDTKLRRRVYEMLHVSACPELKILDGLEVCREEVGKKDGVWDRLIELGILKPKGEGEGRGMIEGANEGGDDGDEEGVA